LPVHLPRPPLSLLFPYTTLFRSPTSRFGIFGIADLYGVYDPKEQPLKNQHMAQTQLTYRIVKGLNVSAGAFFEKHSGFRPTAGRSEEHTSELQSRFDLVCRLLLE